VSLLNRLFGGWVARQKRLDARDQLARMCGLGEIVVRARLEPGDLVVHRDLGGEHQDRD